jgi:hypothetical protein
MSCRGGDNAAVPRLTLFVLVVTIGALATPVGAESVSGRFVDDDGVPGEL